MCNHQQSYTCGGTQKVNTCGAKSTTNNNSCQGAYEVMNKDGTSTAASSDDGASAATSVTMTSPTREKQGFIGVNPTQCQKSKGCSGCGNR